MALYTEISGDQMASLLRGLEEERLRKAKEQAAAERTRITNANKSDNGGLGGLLSNLTRDIKSAANTVNTTFSALFGSPVATAVNNISMANSKNNSQKNLDAIAQKYGYKNKDDAYDKGDGPEEMWKEFQDSTNKTRKEQDQISNEYKNNSFVKKINDTKQSQYGADALRTWTNLARAVAPTTAATLGGASALGAVEGLADTLENANGTVFDIDARLDKNIRNSENATINAGDALRNAAIGATVGGVTAGVGGKLGNARSNIGSKLLNNRVVTSGVGRGAIGGAVGGALGAGINAGIEGGNVLNAALQGAGSGALTGAAAGGLAGGARKVGGKVTDALGVTDKLNEIRGNLMYTPEEQPKAIAKAPEEVTKTTTTTTDNDFDNRTLKGRAAESLKRTGKYLEGMQASLNKSDKKRIGVKDTGKFIDGVRQKTGIDNIADQAEFAKKITGGQDSILDTMQRRALSQGADGKPFYADTSDIYNGIDDVLKSAKVTSSSLGGKSSKDKFVQALQDDLMDSNGDLISLASSWHDAAATFRKSDAAGAKQKAKIYENMARKVEQASYSKIPQENVDGLFDASYQALIDAGKAATNPKAKAAYEKTAEALKNTPHTIEDFRHFKEDFVKVNLIDDMRLENENGGAVRQARTFRGTANAVKDALIEKPAYWAANKVGVGLSNAGEKLAGTATPTTNTTTATPVQRPIGQDMQNIYNLLGLRIGTNEGLDARSNAIKDREFANLENQLGATVSNIQNTYEPEINYYTQPQSQTASLAEQLNTINTAMQNTLAAGDLATYEQLADLYKTTYNTYQMQAELAGTGNNQTKLTEKQQKANAAEELLNELEGLNPDYGYAVRDIPVLNLVNMRGNTYSNAADGLATQLGYMMSGATVTPQEYERIKQQYVPQPWDSEEQRKIKLQRARNIIAQYQKGTA